MEEASTYDMRGRQSGILRLWGFHKEGLVHMLSYRMLVPLSLITAVLIIASLAYNTSAITRIAESAMLLTFILFTPQIFASLKAFSLVYSKGSAFGHLNESFVIHGGRERGRYLALEVLPYLGLAAWLVCLAATAALWFA